MVLIECTYLALSVAWFPDYPVRFMLANPISVIEKASKKTAEGEERKARRHSNLGVKWQGGLEKPLWEADLGAGSCRSQEKALSHDKTLEHSSERTPEGAACGRQNRDAKCPGNVNKPMALDPWQQHTEMDQTHQLGNRWAHWIWVSHLCAALKLSQDEGGGQKDKTDAFH